MEPSSEGWAAGDRVAGRYTIVGAPLGSGATGVVYPGEAEDGRRVAIKRLHDAVTQQPARFARLRQELRRAEALKHPHILPVYDLVPHGRSTAMVTARMDGGAVSELGGPLSVEGALTVAIQIARALVTAHGAGLVHGDVRPGNVLLGVGGAALFDFGLTGVARIGELRPGQTPPEVLDGAPPTERSDLYGLGLVLHHAATGRPAFGGPTAWARIGRQRCGQIDAEGLPPGLVSCLSWLLHPDPLRRPSSAVTVIRMLQMVRRRPDRPAKVPRRRLAPLRFRRTHSVHGVDPSTGARALLRTDLTRREARRLARRLQGEGWQVTAERTAMSWVDAVWVVAAGAVGLFVLPIIGLPLLSYGMLRWRSSRTRHELPRALPTVLAPLPPRRVPAGGEVALTAGLLLALTAVLLLVWPMASLLSLLALVALVADALSRRPIAPSTVARRARIDNELVLARRTLGAREASDLPIDRLLGELGLLDGLEADWRAGSLSDDDMLVALQRWRHRTEEPASVGRTAISPPAPGRPPG